MFLCREGIKYLSTYRSKSTQTCYNVSWAEIFLPQFEGSELCAQVGWRQDTFGTANTSFRF